MLNLRHAKPITEQPLTFRFEERNRERAPTPRGEPARERSPTGATERDVAETAPTRATEGEPNRLSQREILRELSREREREREGENAFVTEERAFLRLTRVNEEAGLLRLTEEASLCFSSFFY